MIDILFEDGEALVIDKPAGLSIERRGAAARRWKIMSSS